ncbi:hypothetical protein Y032_0159g3303 [Ancylostoma ceylanicum]|uniref:Uncharacterized protein n=1 Tax=Ancylostoma ceylanicum TaxID=53326 RepID=A0A016SYK9_9BILA|nr:hypothetical protein Y032_0159g3303 [Ancylostoma ceylanicum]
MRPWDVAILVAEQPPGTDSLDLPRILGRDVSTHGCVLHILVIHRMVPLKKKKKRIIDCSHRRSKLCL